jgi:beta-barrel assembly-enhancing protease
MGEQGTGMSFDECAHPGLSRRGWLWLFMVFFCLPAWANQPGTPAQSVSPADAAKNQLQAAFHAADTGDVNTAQNRVLLVISDSAFSSLEESTRHAALALAVQLDLKTGNFEQAQQLARRATSMPQQSVDDWKNRLTASTRMKDVRDEAESLTVIAQRWGRDSSMLPDSLVRRVVRDAGRTEFQDVRFGLLKALYDLRWRPAGGWSAESWWVDLCAMLLDRQQQDDAIQVAAIVDSPRNVIAFRAVRVFRPLLKSKLVKSDARQAAHDELDALRTAVHQKPRSLMALHPLLGVLVNSRADAEALALIGDAERRIDVTGGGGAPYDDMGRFSYILDEKSRALWHMGRYDEAVRELQRAVALPNRSDSISQNIDLALLLCALDRPDEALPQLPPEDKASAYEKMLIALVRLSAAVERGATDEQDKPLEYLRSHQADGPAILQSGLLRAGAVDEAERVLLSRLHDPLQRISALVAAQIYFEPPEPPRAAQWNADELALMQRPSIRAAVSEFGTIDRYMWTYGFN